MKKNPANPVIAKEPVVEQPRKTPITDQTQKMLQKLRKKFPKIRNIKLSHELSDGLVSIDIDTSLFALGLMILREKNIDNMIKGTHMLEDEKLLEKNYQKIQFILVLL